MREFSGVKHDMQGVMIQKVILNPSVGFQKMYSIKQLQMVCKRVA